MIPRTHHIHANYVLQGEVKTKAHRKGDGFEIGVSQLNAVLRF